MHPENSVNSGEMLQTILKKDQIKVSSSVIVFLHYFFKQVQNCLKINNKVNQLIVIR